MVYNIAQQSSHVNSNNLHSATDVASAQLDSQWQKWAGEGSAIESREIALERFRECLNTHSHKLDLSDLMLESLPNRLPGNITKLFVDGNRLTCLPEQLPSGLKTLDISDNLGLRLSQIPAGLVNLTADNMGLDTLPPLPDSLEVLNVWKNNLKHLPPLPSSLRVLHAEENRLRDLPELPSCMELCNASQNKLTKLPHLPAALRKLMVSENRLTKLPSLPHGLEKLDVSFNYLTKLPALPNTLQKLFVNGNWLNVLNSIPPSLTELDISDNRLKRLPSDLIERFRQLAFVSFVRNPWLEGVGNALASIRLPAPARAPAARAFVPAINASHHGLADARSLLQALSKWYPVGSENRVRQEWAGLSDKSREVQAFSAFLDRLGQVKFAKKTPAFRNAVAQWLTSLARNPALKSEAIAIAYDATQTCEDRVALTWNQLQKASLSHAVSHATADTPKDELLQSAREVCALNLLEEIAANKVEERLLEVKKQYPLESAEVVRSFVDEVEVHLAYPTGLAKKLNLLTPVRQMKFGDASHVKPADLNAAFEHVSKVLEGPKFHFWMNNWEPWTKFLETIYPEEHEEAVAKQIDFYADADLHLKALGEIRLIEGVKTDQEAELILAPYLADKHFAPLTRMALAPGVVPPTSEGSSHF